MLVSIAALQKFMKIYKNNDKTIRINNKIKLNKSILPFMKKFAKAEINDYEH